MERVRTFFERWAPLAWVVAVLALGISAYEVFILREQVSIEGAAPVLSGSVTAVSEEPSDYEAIRSEMLNELFAQTVAASQSTGTTYAEAMVTVLAEPLSRDIPNGPVTFYVTIHNTGAKAATDVNVSIEWDGVINSVDAVTASAWSVEDGGVGEARVVVSLDRISIGETITLIIAYAPTSPGTRRVELTLGTTPEADPDQPAPTNIDVIEFNILAAQNTTPFENVRVQVSSLETALVQIPYQVE
jgi:hypothetical protein